MTKNLLSIFWKLKILLLFYLATKILTAMSTSVIKPEEMKVPYVPYVVVNDSSKNFDFDSLHETISRYLATKDFYEKYPQTTLILESVKKGTTLYDYLKNQDNDQSEKVIINENNKKNNESSNNLNLLQNFGLNNNNNSYPNIIKTVENSRNYYDNKNNNSNQNDDKKYNYYYSNKNKNLNKNFSSINFQPEFFNRTNITPTSSTPQRNNLAIKDQFGEASSLSIQSNLPVNNLQKTPDLSANSQWIHSGDLTCNIKSVRFIRDGNCISKKPVYESVCAERCLSYNDVNNADYELKSTTHHHPNQLYRKNYNSYPKPRLKPIPIPLSSASMYNINPDNPYQYQSPKPSNTHHSNSKIYPEPQIYAGEYYKCIDGEEKKININLHCPGGSVVKHTIRAIKNCICLKQADKVQYPKSRIGHHPRTSKITTPTPGFLSSFNFMKF